jgi:hypothetical protein
MCIVSPLRSICGDPLTSNMSRIRSCQGLYFNQTHIHGMDIAYYDLRYKENISGIIEFNLISTL